MTAPAPRENPDLVGQEEAEGALVRALLGQRMHHAWLLTGPEGIGKATLAYRFARRLFAGRSDTLWLSPDDPVFRRVAAGSHADLAVVEREVDGKSGRPKGEIGVDAVRAATDALRLTPGEGGWRVAIVDGAEHLGRNAANALLKMLEEPPERAVLLLACSAPGRLLPTIRSRCRRLRLGALGRADLDGLLARYVPGADAAGRAGLARLAAGSPGRALMLADEQGIEIAGLARSVLEASRTGGGGSGTARAFEVADRLGRSEQAYSAFMTLLRRDLAEAVAAAARGSSGAEREVPAWLAARPLARWADLWHALTVLQDETERFHLDRQHAVVAGLALLESR